MTKHATTAHADSGRHWRRSLLADLRLMALLSGATLVLFSLIFPPRALWLLGFVALVPWTAAVVRVERPWVVHWGSFLAGFLFFLVNLSWLQPVTGLGFAALAFYLGIYWTLAAWGIRTGLRAGIPASLSLPIVWVACEYLRAWVMSGFPWLFVSHGYSEVLPLIQISDTTGAYGVTFVVLLVSGAILEWWLAYWRAPEPARGADGAASPPAVNAVADRNGGKRRFFVAQVQTAVAAVVLVATVGYGWWRISSAELRDGPRIAVIQEDFPLRSVPPYGDPPPVVFAHYMALAAEAAKHEPDLIVFPETAWNGRQNIDFVELKQEALVDEAAGSWAFGKLCHSATAALARGNYPGVNQVIAHFENTLNRVRQGEERVRLPRLPAESGPPTPLVVGSVAIEVLPESPYPSMKRFNSALKYTAEGEQLRKRYDKIHLVPFGEVVPFRNAEVFGFSLHWLYRLLNSLSPFSSGGSVEYSLWPGEEYTVFELQPRGARPPVVAPATGPATTLATQTTPAADGATYRFGVPICYEDVMPYICREYVWEDGARRVDFLLNISNDGWFMYSDELPQHLAIGVFRAVETRTGIARAVNTGISGFIDPNGRLYGLVEEETRRYGPGLVGYSVQPIKLDDRVPLYGIIGDAFARLCLLIAAVLWFAAIITRWVFALRKWVSERLRGRQPRAATD